MKLTSRRAYHRELNLGLFFGGLVVIGGLVAFLFGEAIAGVMPGCSFQINTGLPCLTCGTTRSVLALRRGDLLTSLRLSPLMWGTISFVTVWSLWSLLIHFKGRRPMLVLTRLEKRALKILVPLLVLGYWGYLVATGV